MEEDKAVMARKRNEETAAEEDKAARKRNAEWKSEWR